MNSYCAILVFIGTTNTASIFFNLILVKKLNMRFPVVILVVLNAILFVNCGAKKNTDVSFLESQKENSLKAPKLNVFVPRKSSAEQVPVLIFVHGGNWNSGRKGTYDLLGRNFASKGVVTVIPDYTLSPNATYDDMAKQIVSVIQWTKNNISQYNGNPNQIFITGHSAGGHLGALAVMNPKYGIDSNSISGIILNDAAGLDMKNYLEGNPPTSKDDYLTTWTSNPEQWKAASPIYFLNKNTPPFLIYVGDKTYNFIKVANSRFLSAMKPFQPDVTPIRLNKKHVPMVVQYFYPWSDRFDEVIDFMKSNIK
ncbi:pimeloyl-ACP methyl ester carboxylesterase [Flavobacterium sp. CG_9.1]|uniref:alpha/beta hydrolase n=1 Tax=Flavobacterium sp. CG_9.1 TaxID=2787728 RepID=UPI001A2DB2F5|nr:pimeloyl-ACP methyl ester carboxylesterase [Flavobacterium sp. CG_9.1]